jgi:hypothetical protein
MVYASSRGDPAFVARLEIPSKGVEWLQNQIEARPNESFSPIGAMSERTSWWKVSSQSIMVERSYAIESSCVKVVLCKESNRFILYVESISF